MWSPGAATATYGCCVLPGHRDPSGSVPATASTPAQDAGSLGPANWLALPELATRTTSWPSAYATAACRTGSQAAAEVLPIPKGRLMTCAPCETAYRIPAAAVRTDAGPEPPTITGRILALGAMPTVPVPVPWPAITTAVAVPADLDVGVTVAAGPGQVGTGQHHAAQVRDGGLDPAFHLGDGDAGAV